MGKKVLVTGGAGLIGSYICKKLLQEGHSPIVYDAFIQYVSPFESYYQKYLEHRFKGFKEEIIFERGDTRDKSDIRRVILQYKPEIVLHLAALPIADLSFTHTEETIGSIINGTVGILDVIQSLDFIERFVYVSSSMIYGDFQEIPAREDHPKSPKDIYGGTKLAGEIMTEAYGRRHGINYTIIRPSGVYGPTDVNRRVIQIFIENALRGEKLVLYGGGENLIDFTYVEDTAAGMVLATLSEKGENEIFNITYGEGRSLKECASILQNHFPNLQVEIKPAQSHRPLRGALSIQKAKDALGYIPKYSLEKGIEKYVNFYREFNSQNQSNA